MRISGWGSGICGFKNALTMVQVNGTAYGNLCYMSQGVKTPHREDDKMQPMRS